MILVTGASGLLGCAILGESVRQGRPCLGVYHGHRLTRVASARVVGCDLSQPDQAWALLSSERPAWVIHCAAWTDVDGCEGDPERASRINTDMSGSLAEFAYRVGSRFLYISTDSVFDGASGRYRESDTPRPLNAYARSKLEGERCVMDASSEAVIVRTNFFGWGPPWQKSLAEWVLCTLESGSDVPGFQDVWFSPVFTNDLVRGLMRIVSSDAQGIFHIGGADRLSKFDFARRLAFTFELPDEHVKPTSVESAHLAAPRPADTSLDSSKVQQLGIESRGIDQSLKAFREMRHSSFRETLDQLVRAG